MDHPNRTTPTRRARVRRLPARAADEPEHDVDHDADVYDELEHDTESDGDDEHAPQHAMGRLTTRRRRPSAQR